jgi:hypothetical protein
LKIENHVGKKEKKKKISLKYQDNRGENEKKVKGQKKGRKNQLFVEGSGGGIVSKVETINIHHKRGCSVHFGHFSLVERHFPAKIYFI